VASDRLKHVHLHSFMGVPASFINSVKFRTQNNATCISGCLLGVFFCFDLNGVNAENSSLYIQIVVNRRSNDNYLT
jgi:hypothetical protein